MCSLQQEPVSGSVVLNGLCLHMSAAAGCWVTTFDILPAALFGLHLCCASAQLVVLVGSVAIGARGSLAVVSMAVWLCYNGSGSFGSSFLPSSDVAGSPVVLLWQQSNLPVSTASCLGTLSGSCFVLGGRHLWALRDVLLLSASIILRVFWLHVVTSMLCIASAPEAGAPLCPVPASCCHHDMSLFLCSQTHDVDTDFPSLPVCVLSTLRRALLLGRGSCKMFL